MRILMLVFPVALLVAYSQIVVKWRVVELGLGDGAALSVRAIKYLSDPILASGYAATLIGALAWLAVVSRLPLVVAFPAYIGMTFALVVLGSWLFLSETLTATKLLSIAFILVGIVLGVRS